MLMRRREGAAVDDETIELIAERVIRALRDDLELIVAELSAPATNEQLTVEQVARLLGVARSTVYAHWRDWGGYKLGAGRKAPIRFDSRTLPVAPPRTPTRKAPDIDPVTTPRRRRRDRPRRDLLQDAPRFISPLERTA